MVGRYKSVDGHTYQVVYVGVSRLIMNMGSYRDGEKVDFLFQAVGSEYALRRWAAGAVAAGKLEIMDGWE